jgi:hypothetical protein
MGEAAIQKAAREHDRNDCVDLTVELLRGAAAGRMPDWADNQLSGDLTRSFPVIYP